MNKKRVLFVAENHKLASGFGTYADNVLRRLHNTGKYELAEFCCYARPEDAKGMKEPWTIYANAPSISAPKEVQDNYTSNPNMQFGTAQFDHACIHFKPDIVLSYRDPWMDAFISKTPLRPYFHWVWMPTVDSEPQKQEWIEWFSSADAILCYSEFGMKTLKNDASHRLNVIGCASPAIDPEIYKPLDKKEVRTELGIPTDINIVGTVMRNQRRKLFPELMKSFKKFLDETSKEIAEKTFLFLHTSYPEKAGWNIPYLMLENNLQGKILTTYICKKCNAFHVDIFKDAIVNCKSCSQNSAVMPSVGLGLSVPDLIKIYNSFDLYVQYAICEGFGMPAVEAAACGIPVAATDYSAMHDVVNFTNGYPIRVQKMFRELETNAERAYPDNDHLSKVMNDHFCMSDTESQAMSDRTRKSCLERYDWDKTAKVWEDYIDTYDKSGKQSQWDSPPEFFNVPESIPEGFKNNSEFLHWAYQECLNNPTKVHDYEGIRFLRNLNCGASIEYGDLSPLNTEGVFNELKSRGNYKNTIEKIRVGMSKFNDDESFLIRPEEK